jgi:aspartate aminotransferase
MTPEQLEAAITPKTKWLILNNPSNPTGAAYSEAELKGLAEVLLRHPDVHGCSPTTSTRSSSMAASSARRWQKVEPRLKDRTITMNGCSKAWAMTGWRIGFAGAPLALAKAMDKLQSQSTSNTSSISQAAAVEALNGPQDELEVMRQVYERAATSSWPAEQGPGRGLHRAGRRLLRLPLHPWLPRQDHAPAAR